MTTLSDHLGAAALAAVAAAVLAASLACASQATPPSAAPTPAGDEGCVKDTDCKGERICDAGKCVGGANTTPEAPPARYK